MDLKKNYHSQKMKEIGTEMKETKTKPKTCEQLGAWIEQRKQKHNGRMSVA